jgi:hypothetical protein
VRLQRMQVDPHGVPNAHRTSRRLMNLERTARRMRPPVGIRDDFERYPSNI